MGDVVSFMLAAFFFTGTFPSTHMTSRLEGKCTVHFTAVTSISWGLISSKGSCSTAVARMLAHQSMTMFSFALWQIENFTWVPR